MIEATSVQKAIDNLYTGTQEVLDYSKMNTFLIIVVCICNVGLTMYGVNRLSKVVRQNQQRIYLLEQQVQQLQQVKAFEVPINNY